MATISKRTNKNGSTRYKAEVFVRGHRKSKSFPSKRDAVEWARQYEMMYQPTVSDDITFRDVMERYLAQVTPTKRGHKTETHRIKYLLDNYPDFFDHQMCDLSKRHVAQWRDQRLQEVSSSTVVREWANLSNAISIAIKEWEWALVNPFTLVKKPKVAPPRDRVAQWHEIKALFRVAEYRRQVECHKLKQRVAAAFVFSFETGMRAKEICGLTWADINGRVASIEDAKTQAGIRKVPLSLRASAVLMQMRPLGYTTIFGLSPKQLSDGFQRLKGELGSPDYTFHDTRAAAITRLAKKLSPHELAMVVGHKDLRMSMVYFRPPAEELAKKLD